MSARLCRWCGAPLIACITKHINGGKPCCRACDHPPVQETP